jgi:hypothetical protein
MSPLYRGTPNYNIRTTLKYNFPTYKWGNMIMKEYRSECNEREG